MLKIAELVAQIAVPKTGSDATSACADVASQAAVLTAEIVGIAGLKDDL